MNLLNIRRHAPSPETYSSALSSFLSHWRSIWISVRISFYVLSATIDCQREVVAIRGGCTREGMEKSRCGSRAVGPVDAGLAKERGGDPVKTRLTRSSSSYYDEGLHLLTRTTAPLLITQSSGRRLRSAERPAPTPSPLTSTSTTPTTTTMTTPTPILPKNRDSYNILMLST